MAEIERKSNLVVRHGHLEDRRAVLAIDTNVYSGLDYLPARYDAFCEDKRRVNYILEANGIAVAFLVATVVDEGEGVIFQAARTHPAHRQLGYYNYLKRAAAKELKVLYPNLKEVLYTAGSATPNDSGVYSVGGERKIIISKGFYLYDLTEPKVRLKVRTALEKQQHYVSGVQKIEFSKLEEFLKKDDFKKHIEADRVIIEWVPYKLDIPSNFSLSHRFPEFFSVSHDEQGKIDGVSFYVVFRDEDRDYEKHDLELYCSTKEACMKHYAFFFQSVIENQKYKNVFCETQSPVCVDNGLGEKLEETFHVVRWLYTEPPIYKNEVRYITLVSDAGYYK